MAKGISACVIYVLAVGRSLGRERSTQLPRRQP